MDRGEYGQGLIERYRLGEWHKYEWYIRLGGVRDQPLIGSREEAMEVLRAHSGTIELFNEVRVNKIGICLANKELIVMEDRSTAFFHRWFGQRRLKDELRGTRIQ